ncbi:hypothetical protein SISNIDRAFT_454312 [Sistotremastrum niveocremeum HHB9708]|uniref:DUF6699 domain-containing protein n=2 Tax=Sistotremastraceae TaxID=3402574 RepID=A0A164V6P1_9AGAM|nr:hypothetical protein SISNIDRAFT_454312 [Sistotremastrum niveocremeum HHB9708]KZT36433.1 hypothetical protein SISSUDRAFT_1049851 [Sistotremastrum suecicum HHB10207 ss-3]
MGRHSTSVVWQGADARSPLPVTTHHVQRPLPKSNPGAAGIASPQALKPLALPPIALSIVNTEKKVSTDEDLKLPSYDAVSEYDPSFIPSTPKWSTVPLPMTTVGSFASGPAGVSNRPLFGVSKPILLHDLLFNTKQFLYLDLSVGLDSMKFLHPDTPKYFADPATDPAIGEMEIICGTLEWSVRVKNPARGYITCSDLLEAIVADMKGSLPRYGGLGGRGSRRISTARVRRGKIETTFEMEKHEQGGEISKVSLLGTGSVFAGLTSVRSDSRKWKLCVIKA